LALSGTPELRWPLPVWRTRFEAPEKTGYILDHPELLDLEQFRIGKRQKLCDVLIDVLAMWARDTSNRRQINKQLELTQKGIDALRAG